MNLTDMVALETAALELPRADRVHLAERLIESLDTDDEVLQAWIDESERRLDAIEQEGTPSLEQQCSPGFGQPN